MDWFFFVLYDYTYHQQSSLRISVRFDSDFSSLFSLLLLLWLSPDQPQERHELEKRRFGGDLMDARDEIKRSAEKAEQAKLQSQLKLHDEAAAARQAAEARVARWVGVEVLEGCR